MSQKELYRLLREARAQKDDAACVRILTQIVQADPQDTSAAVQLTELKKHAEKKAASGANSQTKELFRKLRSAIVEHDDDAAYRIVLDVLKIDPQNRDAEIQKVEIGKRLAKRAAAPLKDMVEKGEPAAVAALVKKLRSYAEEGYLQTLPEYAPAAYMADNFLKQQAQHELEKNYAEWVLIQDLPAREKQARRMEKQAMEAGAEFSQDQREALFKVHAEWEAHCHRQQQLERLQELQQNYEDICIELKRSKKYADAALALSACLESLASVKELPEAADFTARVESKCERVKKQQELLLLKRKVRRKIAAAVVLILLTVAGFCGYAYDHVGEMNHRLNTALAAHQAESVRAQVNVNPYLVRVCCIINSDYAATLNKCRKYLNDWGKTRRSYGDCVYQMQLMQDAVTMENLAKLLSLLMTSDTLEEKLAKEYSDAPTHEQIMQKESFINALGQLRDHAMEQFKNPPQQASPEQLCLLYREYVAFRQAMSIKEEEQNLVVNAFDNVLRQRWPFVNSEQELRRHLKEFDSVAVEMELPASMREALCNRITCIQQLKSLPQSENIEEYIGILEASPVIFTFAASPPCAPEQMRQMASFAENPDTAVYLALEKMQAEGKIEPNWRHALDGMSGCRHYLEQVLGVYANGDSYCLGQPLPASLNNVVERMTSGKDAPIWRNDYKSISDGKNVYIGRVSSINNKYQVIIFNSSGEEKRRIRDITSVNGAPVKVRLSDLRTKCLMKSFELRSGNYTPADLFRAIAGTDAGQYPLSARAYLFGLAVDMVKMTPNQFLSGSLLSPSLRKDMRHYKELAMKDNIREGCWMEPHSVATERMWQDFFSSVKSHEYKTEIVKNLRDILKRKIVFAAYVDEKRNLCYLKTARPDEKLYYVSNNELLPYDVHAVAPFTPLFALR